MTPLEQAVVAMASLLGRHGIPHMFIGGVAVNHWATEPMVTQDVELLPLKEPSRHRPLRRLDCRG